MKVQCTENTLDAIPGELRKKLQEWFPSGPDLAIGAKYSVMAVIVRDGMIWYVLYQHPDSSLPVAYPSLFFTVVDPSPSSRWVLGSAKSKRGRDVTLLAFKEWVSDELFYEHLCDGDESARAAMLREREMIEIE
jgi:hypothetical protein